MNLSIFWALTGDQALLIYLLIDLLIYLLMIGN